MESSPAQTWRRVSPRKKLFSLGAGLILLALGVYILVGEHLAGVSDNAAVNAQLLVVRAPINGVLYLRIHGVGSRVTGGETLGEIIDERSDTSRLAELKRTETSLQADLERIGKQRELISKTQRAFAAYAEDYRQGRVKQLEARLGEARAQTEAAQARLREASSALQRANALSERGVQTAANQEKAQAAYEVAAEDLKVTKEKTSYLSVELEAARSGTFLGDSYNDAPYSLQRARELGLRLAETESETNHVSQRLKEIREQIVSEQHQVARQSIAPITVTTTGIAWDYLANSGEVVRKGQDLIRLVDCSSTIISASVSERLYNSLKIGAQATFRLRGDDHVFEATIVRLAGSGAASRYDNFAVKPPPDYMKKYDVTLASPQLLNDPEARCAVGRTGRVVFSSSSWKLLYYLRMQLGV